MVISIKINNPRVFFGGKLIYKLKVSIKNSEMHYIPELLFTIRIKTSQACIFIFSHPDFTVGFGISPNHAYMARGL